MSKYPNMDKELIFIIISVLITGGLAINAHISNNKKDKYLEDKTEKIVNLQTKLNDKSEKLISTQDELLKYTTGKEGYGIVEVLKISDNKDGYYYLFYFSNKSNYPLYDVKINLLDRHLLDKESLKERNGVATLEDLKNYDNFDIGTIGGDGGGTTFGAVFDIEPNTIRDFLFTINTRGLSFSQQLKFIEKEKELFKATKLNSISSENNPKIETLVDKADEKFPESNNGKIKWE
jgi:hypothetical protein